MSTALGQDGVKRGRRVCVIFDNENSTGIRHLLAALFVRGYSERSTGCKLIRGCWIASGFGAHHRPACDPKRLAAPVASSVARTSRTSRDTSCYRRLAGRVQSCQPCRRARSGTGGQLDDFLNPGRSSSRFRIASLRSAYCRGQIHLGNDRDIGRVEDRRVLQRLVFTLGDRHAARRALVRRDLTGGQTRLPTFSTNRKSSAWRSQPASAVRPSTHRGDTRYPS